LGALDFWMKKTIIIIAGPTASGKSKLALALAKKVNGAVINADSMQVYSSFPILSAQPDKHEQAEVQHYLYGDVTPPEICSAALWQKKARAIIEQCIEKNIVPIVVGGTGLYLESLMHGLSDIPDVPDEMRQQVAQDYHKIGGAEFLQKLNSVDSATASRLHANDQQRLIRAYSVYLSSGQPLSYYQMAGLMTPPPEWQFSSIVLQPDRIKLYEQIDARFTCMLDKGALNEIEILKTNPINLDHPVLKTLGVRELWDFLYGKQTLPQANMQAQQNSRNYAKRQETWFKNRFLTKEIGLNRPVLTFLSAADAIKSTALEEFIAHLG
jgi:tRNA dimethylallyltransferase